MTQGERVPHPPGDVLSPAYQPGLPGIATCIVLSAPGRLEERAGHPAAGATGANLDLLLGVLHDLDAERFPYAERRAYPIINAHPNVEYPAKTGRSEAPLREIRSPENVERLARLLGPHSLALALGTRAVTAVTAARFAGTVLHGIHPGNQALNLTYASDAGTPRERRVARIAAMAHDLLQQLEGSDDRDENDQRVSPRSGAALVNRRGRDYHAGWMRKEPASALGRSYRDAPVRSPPLDADHLGAVPVGHPLAAPPGRNGRPRHGVGRRAASR